MKCRCASTIFEPSEECPRTLWQSNGRGVISLILLQNYCLLALLKQFFKKGKQIWIINCSIAHHCYMFLLPKILFVYILCDKCVILDFFLPHCLLAQELSCKSPILFAFILFLAQLTVYRYYHGLLWIIQKHFPVKETVKMSQQHSHCQTLNSLSDQMSDRPTRSGYLSDLRMKILIHWNEGKY